MPGPIMLAYLSLYQHSTVPAKFYVKVATDPDNRGFIFVIFVQLLCGDIVKTIILQEKIVGGA